VRWIVPQLGYHVNPRLHHFHRNRLVSLARDLFWDVDYKPGSIYYFRQGSPVAHYGWNAVQQGFHGYAASWFIIYAGNQKNLGLREDIAGERFNAM